MAKIRGTEIRAKRIDRIFSNAIAKIANGEQEFSCCAIGTLFGRRDRQSLTIRQFYADVFASRPGAKPPHELLFRVTDHVGARYADKSQGFRILMLSLVKAAWRDLV